jgi:hypothetical protein
VNQTGVRQPTDWRIADVRVPRFPQVPEGFGAAHLGGGDLDCSSERAARQAAAEIFARRFVAVRSQVRRTRQHACTNDALA